jgi:hypothetical protein
MYNVPLFCTYCAVFILIEGRKSREGCKESGAFAILLKWPLINSELSAFFFKQAKDAAKETARRAILEADEREQMEQDQQVPFLLFRLPHIGFMLFGYILGIFIFSASMFIYCYQIIFQDRARACCTCGPQRSIFMLTRSAVRNAQLGFRLMPFSSAY